MKTTDAENKTIKAIALYKKLLAFHKDDTDKSALLDADLHRLRFGWNKAVGEAKNARYKAALEAFAKANDGHELYAMARFQFAGVVQGEGDLVKARDIALSGTRAYPDSPGGKLCFNLVQDIESKAASATTERVWADPLPTIKVNYKNITKAYFRVVPADYVERLKGAQWRPEQLTSVKEIEGGSGQEAGAGVQPRPAGHPGLQGPHGSDPGARRDQARVLLPRRQPC